METSSLHLIHRHIYLMEEFLLTLVDFQLGIQWQIKVKLLQGMEATTRLRKDLRLQREFR